MAKLEDGQPNVEYRPVAVDDKKTRYLFKHNQGGGWSSSATFPGIVLAHYGFRLDPKQLPFDRVRSLGIEVVPAEVTRAADAAKSVGAFQEAREAGIELLPRAELGKPFEFSLTDSQGHALRSAALKGKVVLIDVWASWRSPCMGKMAEVKSLYEGRRRDGFEVVGVNFENNRATTERLVKTLGLPWPQVIVPNDDADATPLGRWPWAPRHAEAIPDRPRRNSPLEWRARRAGKADHRPARCAAAVRKKISITSSFASTSVPRAASGADPRKSLDLRQDYA